MRHKALTLPQQRMQEERVLEVAQEAATGVGAIGVGGGLALVDGPAGGSGDGGGEGGGCVRSVTTQIEGSAKGAAVLFKSVVVATTLNSVRSSSEMLSKLDTRSCADGAKAAAVVARISSTVHLVSDEVEQIVSTLLLTTVRLEANAHVCTAKQSGVDTWVH